MPDPNSANARKPKEYSSHQLAEWRSKKVKAHWQLSDGSSVVGTVIWFDRFTIGIDAEQLGAISVPKHSIVW